jgi:uncharacterized protein DUF6776
MSAPRSALIRRQLRQLFGITARRVRVRTEMPWHWRALLWGGALSGLLVVAGWLYGNGRHFAGFDQEAAGDDLPVLREKLAGLEEELAQLRSVSRGVDTRLQVEKATQDELTVQLRSLQRENATLKEELAVFEGFVSGAGGQASGLRIVRVTVEALDSTRGRYRYRVLLVNRAATRGIQEVRGDLQFELQVGQNGKDASIKLPGGDHAEAARYRVTVKHFHRVEGEFSVPPGAVLKGGEVRLLQDGQVKARQAIAL